MPLLLLFYCCLSAILKPKIMTLKVTCKKKLVPLEENILTTDILFESIKTNFGAFDLQILLFT